MLVAVGGGFDKFLVRSGELAVPSKKEDRDSKLNYRRTRRRARPASHRNRKLLSRNIGILSAFRFISDGGIPSSSLRKA